MFYRKEVRAFYFLSARVVVDSLVGWKAFLLYTSSSVAAAATTPLLYIKIYSLNLSIFSE